MNEWTPGRTPMHLKDGSWQTDLRLFPGKYQYKLVLDKKWVLDPGNPESVDNNIGGTNSLLRAGAVNPSGAPYLFTINAEKDKITLGIKNKTRKIFVFWQNYQLDEQFLEAGQQWVEDHDPKESKKHGTFIPEGMGIQFCRHFE